MSRFTREDLTRDKTEPNTDEAEKPCGKLDLRSLKRDYRPGITPNFGAFLAESAAVSFDSVAHKSGVMLMLDGDYDGLHPVIWGKVTDQMRRSHADPLVATEYGACGIAVLLVDMKTRYSVIERARKGTGFDFWLGSDKDRGPYFQHKARLEVSGIHKGDETELRRRVGDKVKQTDPTDHTGLPAHIVVVEFGAPRSRMVTK